MAYWLLKSEPDSYSFAQMQQDRRTAWSGVRNHQAANNLRAMQPGDLAFFYHSNTGREIVGVVEILRTAYPDPSDASGKFVMVDVGKPVPMPQPIGLAEIKTIPALRDLPLLKQSRLSVMPISGQEWQTLCKMGGYKPLGAKR